MSILQVNHLAKTFSNDTIVLKDISFTVEKGECLSIIGSSGSGKSTLLRCLNLLETPTSGEIIFNNENILDKKVNKNLIRSKLCMVFQSFNLFNNMDVLANCVIGQVKVLKRNKKLENTVLILLPSNLKAINFKIKVATKVNNK